MLDQKNEQLKPLSESGTPADLWDFIHNETGINPDLCKTVIFHMLYGLNLIRVAIKCGLMIDDMVRIREAFDQYTHEHKEI